MRVSARELLNVVFVTVVLMASSACSLALDHGEGDLSADLAAAAAAAADAPAGDDWRAYIRQNRFVKRGKTNDPRNLFAAIYDNYGANVG